MTAFIKWSGGKSKVLYKWIDTDRKHLALDNVTKDTVKNAETRKEVIVTNYKVNVMKQKNLFEL